MRIIIGVLVLGVFSTACSSGSQPGQSSNAAGNGGARGLAGITLRVAPERPSRGSEVRLILRNDSTEAIGYNLCVAPLTRQVGETWQPVPSDRVCTMELRTLAPGSEESYPHPIPADLPPGSYRFATMIELLTSGGRRELTTETFSIGA